MVPRKRAVTHDESHRSHRIGWLRAATLGANDGLISTSSPLLLGAESAHLGGASRTREAQRVAFWGAVAMGCTAAAGRLAGTFL